MLATMDVMTSPPTVEQTAAQRAAHDYVIAYLDPTFELVDGAKYYSKFEKCAFEMLSIL